MTTLILSRADLELIQVALEESIAAAQYGDREYLVGDDLKQALELEGLRTNILNRIVQAKEGTV